MKRLIESVRAWSRRPAEKHDYILAFVVVELAVVAGFIVVLR